MQSVFENNYLYTILELYRLGLTPLRTLTQASQHAHASSFNLLADTNYGRSMAASLELFERLTRHYKRPAFGIHETTIDGETVKVHLTSVIKKTFCKLLHFKKQDFSTPQPKLLIVAPMSGHYATLLRGTVEGFLPFYDVYITDWENASDIPLSEGEFTLDDFIDYVIEFTNKLGPNLHVVAVCQPSVPVLAAVSIMAAENHPKQPRSMILIGGPIDTRHSPTEVNNVAKENSLQWFATHAITRVPANYPGFMRCVYPGFLQLSGFISMNLERHIEEHIKLYNHLVEGDGESAETHKKFYNEYLSVMDLPAEFYLQTIQTVFQDHALPCGTMQSRGRKVNPACIKHTALLAIEGEKDDISGIGQTKAALGLCQGLSTNKKQYILQKDVGHYGLFNGRKFRQIIVPEIVDFTSSHH